MIGPENQSVHNRPCILNWSVHAASTAANTTGKYSGRHPAITALIATFSTVHSTNVGGTIATRSSGCRLVPVSIRATRSSVGGTMGNPSDQPRSNIASNSSSRVANSTRRLCIVVPPNLTAKPSAKLGSTDSDPHPGRVSGSSIPKSSTPDKASQSGRLHPTVLAISLPSCTYIKVGTVSTSKCHDILRSWSCCLESTVSGNVGSSWV